MQLDHVQISVARVLQTDAEITLLNARSQELCEADSRLSSVRSVEIAAAELLARYQREQDELDKFMRQFRLVPPTLPADILIERLVRRLQELDEVESFASYLVSMSGSRTLIEDAEQIQDLLNRHRLARTVSPSRRQRRLRRVVHTSECSIIPCLC
jgi:septation ring formation regulator EzrA